ncbi:MAG: hypothetical protein ACFFCZ_10595 [Promethearchaeota archaeon]
MSSASCIICNAERSVHNLRNTLDITLCKQCFRRYKINGIRKRVQEDPPEITTKSLLDFLELQNTHSPTMFGHLQNLAMCCQFHLPQNAAPMFLALALQSETLSPKSLVAYLVAYVFTHIYGSETKEKSASGALVLATGLAELIAIDVIVCAAVKDKILNPKFDGSDFTFEYTHEKYENIKSLRLKSLKRFVRDFSKEIPHPKQIKSLMAKAKI